MSISSTSSSLGSGSWFAGTSSPAAAACSRCRIIASRCSLTSCFRSNRRFRVWVRMIFCSASARIYRAPVRQEQVTSTANSKRNMTIMLGRACWITLLIVYRSIQTSYRKLMVKEMLRRR